MARLARLYKSSIGAKAVMAITGAMLFLFLIGHLAGNLLVFKGQDALNGYAQGLQNLGPLLWVIRLGLLAVFLAHFFTALKLHHANREARPVAYHREDTVKATWASRYMMLTGMVVLTFVVYHLLHFTFHQFAPRGITLDDEGRKDVYKMVITGFQSTPIVLSYVAAHVFLLIHLLHGISSVFQTMGWNNDTINPLVKKGLPALALVIVLGKLTIAFSIYLGIVGG
ncbi:MAG: succinate dehydrogenase cytochrome b subunit [Planctomycetota bacterium]